MGEAFVEASASVVLPTVVGHPAADAPSVVPLSLGLPVGDGHQLGAMPAFELVVTCSEGMTTVAVCGELDMEAAPMLARSLDSFPEADGGPGFAIDLDRMSFVDAAGLRAFVPSIRRLAARGQRLVVRRPSPLALTVLDVSGLAPALAIEH
jgi:anti-anti-sigma factor